VYRGITESIFSIEQEESGDLTWRWPGSSSSMAWISYRPTARRRAERRDDREGRTWWNAKQDGDSAAGALAD